MSKDSVKTQIDTDITNKTTSKSISPLNVGNNMKAVVDLIPDIIGKEDISNKSINIITDGTSDTKYPSVKAVKTYVDLNSRTQDLQSVVEVGGYVNLQNIDGASQAFIDINAGDVSNPAIVEVGGRGILNSGIKFLGGDFEQYYINNLGLKTSVKFEDPVAEDSTLIFPAKPIIGTYTLATLDDIPALVDSRPYKVYTVLLTQSLTNAPVATILENTLGGTVVFSYSGVGSYVATLTGVFILNKTWCSITSTASADVTVTAGRSSDNTVNINSFLSGTLTNSIMSPTCLEIRVYN